MKQDKPIWVDEQKYYLAIILLCIFIAMPLIVWSRNRVAAISCLALLLCLYSIFCNYLLPVKLYNDRLRLARYRKWIFFPRTDVAFADIESIKVRTINKTDHKEMGATKLSAESAMIRVLIVKDKHRAEYINIIFDRKTFTNKLKEVNKVLGEAVK